MAIRIRYVCPAVIVSLIMVFSQCPPNDRIVDRNPLDAECQDLSISLIDSRINEGKLTIVLCLTPFTPNGLSATKYMTRYHFQKIGSDIIDINNKSTSSLIVGDPIFHKSIPDSIEDPEVLVDVEPEQLAYPICNSGKGVWICALSMPILQRSDVGSCHININRETVASHYLQNEVQRLNVVVLGSPCYISW